MKLKLRALFLGACLSVSSGLCAAAVEQPLGQLHLYEHVRKDWGGLVDFGMEDGCFVADLARAKAKGHTRVTFISRSLPLDGLSGRDVFIQVTAKGLRGKVNAMFEGRTKRGAHYWVAREFDLGTAFRTGTMVRRLADDLAELHLRIDVTAAEKGPVTISRIVYGEEDGSHREEDPRVWRRPELLFHATFDGSPDAAFAAGEAKPVMAKNISYSAGVKGQAVVATRAAKSALAYAAGKNVDPERGAVAFWLKRDWADRGVQSDGKRILRGMFSLSCEDGKSRPGDGAVRAWFDGPWARFDLHDDDSTVRLGGTFPMDCEWHHVIFNWDDEDASIYLDGRPIRGVPDSYSPGQKAAREPRMLHYSCRRTFDRFFVGSAESCAFDACIDEFMVFSAPLGIAEAEALYRRVLPVKIDVLPSYAWEGNPEKLKVVATSPIGRDISGLSHVVCDATGAVVRAGLPETTDFPAGQYWIRMTDGESFFGKGSLGVLRSGANPYEDVPSGVPGAIGVENLQLVSEIRFDRLRPTERFKAYGELRLGDCAGAKYLEAGMRQNDRFAVGFDVDPAAPLYQLEIDYPDDAFRTMDVVVQDAASHSGDYTMQCGVATGREYPNTGKMLTHRVLFWPRSARCAAIFMTARDKAPAAVAALRVYRVANGRLPAVKPVSPPLPAGNPGRTVGVYFEDPAMIQDFSVPRSARDAEGLDMMIDRMAAVMKYNGENLLVYPGSWYQGLIRRDGYNARNHANDFLTAFYMKFDREGLSLMPSINRHNILSTPSVLVTPRSMNDGSLNGTEIAIMDDGRPNPGGWHGTPPTYCIAHPRVQASILEDVDALVAQGRSHPSFKGIALHLTCHSMLWWGSASCGYNDYAVEAFSLARNVRVPLDRSSPQRGRTAAEWIRKNAWDAWLDWRCDVLADFYAQIDARLKAARPDLRLRLDSRVNGGARAPRFDEPDYERAMAREAGLDVARMQARIPDVIVAETLSPATPRIAGRDKYPSDARYAAEIAAFGNARTWRLLDGVRSPVVVLHDAYFENPCGRTGVLNSDWLAECLWRVSVINPSGEAAISHIVKPMRFRDLLGVDKGGFLVGTYGMERHLASFARAFRALPPVVMDDVPGGSDTVKVRATTYGGKSYFYMVNTSGELAAVTARMPAGTVDMSGGEAVRTTFSRTLRPYELKSFRAPCGVPEDVEVRAAETNYTFRARLEDAHPARRSADAAPQTAEETLVDASWSIMPASADPVLLHGARDLSDYFGRSMGIAVPVATNANPASRRCIRIRVDASLPGRQSKVEVDGDLVTITGDTPREAAQGCYRLEDMMNNRGMPAVKRGVRTFTRMFSPRMTHSGWGEGVFPDAYLDRLAHAGMDAIVKFVYDPQNMACSGRDGFPSLVERARLRGIDVYAYCLFCVKAAKFHPSDLGAAEWYERTYGAIFRNAPGIKGIICVGEGVAFPSRDGHTAGFWWGRKEERVPGKPRNGFYPSEDWPEWLEAVKSATRKYRPDAEILFWTYNWFWAPEAERVRLLERIPTDVSLLVTFEMGDRPVKKLGVDTFVQDYSITRPGPGTVFASEAEVASRRGIRLLSMANTGGRTWDLGIAPCEPVPRLWLERFRALRAARTRWGLSGLMESHHYGYAPNFIGEIAKVAFTAESGDADIEDAVRAIAARDFGIAGADEVVAAWNDWSDAFQWRSARAFDLGGPQRVGPAYPLVLPGAKFPPPLNPLYECYEGNTHGNGWKYLENGYGIPPSLIAPYIEMSRREIACWRKGNDRIRSVLPNVPRGKQSGARRMAALGEMFEHSARTAFNSRLFKRDGLVFSDPKSPPYVREAARCSLLETISDEENNVREAIPAVEEDSSIGWEPTMGYVCDPANLEWKLHLLARVRKLLRRQ